MTDAQSRRHDGVSPAEPETRLGGSRPLDGLRIVELADWIAAPYAAAVLGDFGAEIIKIELPGRLDHTRGGERLPDGADRSPGFVASGRNKRSVALDTRSAEGRSLFGRLLGRCDALVTNLRVESLAEVGLDFERLDQDYPHLVALVISGFGMTGPLHQRGAVDRVAQAFSGLTFLIGYPDAPPVRAGLAVADYMAGWVGALGVTLALYERHSSGRGQMVDIGLYEPILPLMAHSITDYMLRSTVATRTGNDIAAVAPGGVFETRDGKWVQVSASSDHLFQSLMRVVGRPELGEEERFATAAKRHAALDELRKVIGGWTSSMDMAEALARLDDAGVPCAPINTVADIVADPQVNARGNVIRIHDAEAGDVSGVGPLPRLTRTPGLVEQGGPHHGQHTAEILGDLLGVSDEELSGLRARGVVGNTWESGSAAQGVHSPGGAQ